MKPWMIALQILGALPLLIYPSMLLDNVKSLTGYKAPKEYEPLGRLFLWSSLMYPVAFALCVTLAWDSSDERLALVFSVAPLIYLALVAFCLFMYLRKIFRT